MQYPTPAPTFSPTGTPTADPTAVRGFGANRSRALCLTPASTTAADADRGPDYAPHAGAHGVAHGGEWGRSGWETLEAELSLTRLLLPQFPTAAPTAWPTPSPTAGPTSVSQPDLSAADRL
jgi:hypothetical protein